ncbi:sugar transferase [Chryseobacterium taklimakanense]|uniref:sugar transferase n=1 Tax=Chryseobacterium taklimakanense TaxID=536441 RepID=UPI0021D42B66|nr:sugar transferase [Chryseobacterium taklimakanense]
MIRFFDLIFSFFGLLFLSPVMMVLYIIGLFDTGSPVFVQERVGKGKKPFNLYKFRTMEVNTKSVATHLSSSSSVTKFGSFLRKTKLDELPQLINVLKGDMSLVGPRPNLFNQTELIKERDSRGVYSAVPGITGLAQINEVDMSTPKKLAEMDAEMLRSLSVSSYFKYIFATVGGKGQGDRIVK